MSWNCSNCYDQHCRRLLQGASVRGSARTLYSCVHVFAATTAYGRDKLNLLLVVFLAFTIDTFQKPLSWLPCITGYPKYDDSHN